MLARLTQRNGCLSTGNANKKKVLLANDLMQKFFQCLVVYEQGGHFFLEHPEQLGLTAGQIPASIWDRPEVSELLCQKGVRTFAIFQCQFFAPSSKLTRFLTTLDLKVGYKGLHELDAEGRYLGPLPKQCPHGANAHKALVGKDEDGKWKTAPSATYPPELCQWIPSIAWPALLRDFFSVQRLLALAKSFNTFSCMLHRTNKLTNWACT